MAKKRSTKKRWSAAGAGEIALDSALVGGSAITSTLLVNKLPMIGSLPRWGRAATQAAIGLLALWFIPKKQKIAMRIAAGMPVGAAINLMLPYFPGTFLSGGRRPMTKDEISALTMGVPYSSKSSSMGIPYSTKSNNAMGIPVKISGANGRYSKRGSRGYAGNY